MSAKVLLALVAVVCTAVAGTLAAAAGEVCCQDLGCYAPDGDYHSVLRPINSVPDCGFKDSIFLRLNTRDNKKETDLLNPYEMDTIRKSRFNASRKTKILIHGFMDRYTRPGWVMNMGMLLQDGDYNVVRVDWSIGNVAPYVQACANLRLVGAYVAKFIDRIVTQLGSKPEDIHIIGHSLGAHGAGYAGAICQSKYNFTIGRITGLDPAGPYFGWMNPSVRLDPTDAAVVDTVITNGDPGWAFGSTQSMGHINFHPNGGTQQPGCSKAVLSSLQTAVNANDTIFDQMWKAMLAEAGNVFWDVLSLKKRIDLVSDATALDTFGCSHNFAVLLHAGAIVNPDCTMKSYQCKSFEAFKANDGDCATCAGEKACSPLGFRANLSLAEPGKEKDFYTVTIGQAPFCAKLIIDFTVANSTTGKNNVPINGQVFVTIYGTRGTTERLPLTKNAVDFYPGTKYQYVPEITKEVGELKWIVLRWEVKKSGLGMLNVFSKDYLNLQGDIHATDVHGVVSTFAITGKPQLESGKDVTARLTGTHDL